MATIPVYDRRISIGSSSAARMPSSLGYAVPTQGLRQLPPGVSRSIPMDEDILRAWAPEAVGGSDSSQETGHAQTAGYASGGAAAKADAAQGMLDNLNAQAARFEQIKAETSLLEAKNAFARHAGNLAGQHNSSGEYSINYQEVKKSLAQAEESQSGNLQEPYTSAFRSWASTQADKVITRLHGLEQSGLIQQAAQQRSQFIALKQTEYGQAGPKQRALIEHEVADLLNRQVMSGLISPDQSGQLLTRFTSNVSQDSVRRSLSNALNSAQPVKTIQEIMQHLEQGAPSGLDETVRAQFKGLAEEMLEEAKANQKLQRLNRAQEDAWYASGGKLDKANGLVSQNEFVKKHDLEPSERALVTEALKARRQQMDEREKRIKDEHASVLAAQVLEQAGQGRPQEALALMQVHSKALDKKAAKNLRAMVLKENPQTEPEDWVKALDEVFGKDEKPSTAWMLKKGVFPDKAAQLTEAYEQKNQMSQAGETNYFQDAIKSFNKNFSGNSKLEQKRGEYIGYLWSAMRNNSLSFDSAELIEHQNKATEKVLSKMALSMDW